MKTLLDCVNIALIFKVTAQLNRSNLNQNTTFVHDKWVGDIFFSLKTILV